MNPMEHFNMLTLRARRRALGMTQQQLGDRLGVCRSAVAMWETASAFPSISILPRLAEALQCEISDLYADDFNEDSRK